MSRFDYFSHAGAIGCDFSHSEVAQLSDFARSRGLTIHEALHILTMTALERVAKECA